MDCTRGSKNHHQATASPQAPAQQRMVPEVPKGKSSRDRDGLTAWHCDHSEAPEGEHPTSPVMPSSPHSLAPRPDLSPRTHLSPAGRSWQLQLAPRGPPSHGVPLRQVRFRLHSSGRTGNLGREHRGWTGGGTPGPHPAPLSLVTAGHLSLCVCHLCDSGPTSWRPGYPSWKWCPRWRGWDSGLALCCSRPTPEGHDLQTQAGPCSQH